MIGCISIEGTNASGKLTSACPNESGNEMAFFVFVIASQSESGVDRDLRHADCHSNRKCVRTLNDNRKCARTLNDSRKRVRTLNDKQMCTNRKNTLHCVLLWN